MEDVDANEYVFTQFEKTCARYPDHPALVYLGEKYSFAKLEELVARFATAAHARGIRDNDKVILYLPNCPQWIIAYLGLQKIGAVPVPISPLYTAYEVEYMAQDSGAKAIVCQDTNFGYVKQLLPKTQIEQVIVANLADLLPLWKRAVGVLLDKIPHGRVEQDPRVHFFMDLLKHPPQPPHVEMNPREHLAYILYTGGTTGFPKGVPGTHGSMVSYVRDASAVVRAHIQPTQDVFILVNPLFHIMAKGMLFTLGLNPGCTTIVMPQPQIDAVLETIQRYRVTCLLGVPALYRMILENDRLDRYDLSSLRVCYCGGDTLPLEVFHRWEQKTGVKIRQVYGSTEVGFVSLGRLDQDPVPMSVGSLFPSRRYRIVDPETLQPVTEGAVGELLVTSDYIIKEYWNKPAETARAYIPLAGEVWYRMGDFVRQEKDDVFYVDRSADLIKYKGYRVSASEIETVLQDHPAVIGACVVGVPDPGVGERIKAIVVMKEGTRGVSSSELLRWCRERLAPYKVPQYIEFRDMLPKSKVGKLLRREIRDEERRRAGKAKQ